MKAYEEAEAAEMEQMSVADEEAGQVRTAQQTPSPSNWRYFWAGQSVLGREAGGEAVRRRDAEAGMQGSGNGRRGWRFWRR